MTLSMTFDLETPSIGHLEPMTLGIALSVKELYSPFESAQFETP